MEFLKRYNYSMLIIFVLILSIISGFIYLQYTTQYNYELATIKNLFNERSLQLNFLKLAKIEVENLQNRAESYFQTHPTYQTPSPLLSQIQENVAENYFHLDVVTQPFYTSTVGNLTGVGRFSNRSTAFYREVEMALDLNNYFQMIKRSIPNTVWVYYTSANSFINLFPWEESQHFKFSPDLYQSAFYSLALPTINPDKKAFWTEPYIDQAGQGLMVTCSAPVYESNQFRGTVSLDFTLNVLNQYIKDLKYYDNHVFIINEQEKLLAHNLLINAKDEKIQTAEVAFPLEIRKEWRTLFKYPESEVVEIENYLIIYKTIPDVNWKLIFWIPKSVMVQQVITNISWVLFVLLISLILILFFNYYITQKEFIRPARLLVEHIKNESEGQTVYIPNVSPLWQKWFITVSNTFAENRRLFKELENHSNSLMRLNQEKNEFLGITAHDLKNPLSAILGVAALVKESSEDITQTELLEYMELVENSSNTMFQLISNLLDVNLIESGRVDLNINSVDITQIAEHILETYLYRAQQKDISYQFEIPEKPAYLLTDAHLVHQIIDNLVSNALKYSPLHKKVTLKIQEQEEWLTCAIQDEGLGLSETDQQKLFNKFTRLTPKPTAGEHSTGLGLFIVKKLVDMLGGKIQCFSELGKGTCFEVRLPKKLNI